GARAAGTQGDGGRDRVVVATAPGVDVEPAVEHPRVVHRDGVRPAAAGCLQFQPGPGGNVHACRGGPRVEGHRVVAVVPLDVEMHACRPGQVVAVEVGREGVVAGPKFGVEVEATREVAARSRPRVGDGVVAPLGIDEDTLNVEGGGEGHGITGNDDAGGTVIDDGHVVVRVIADDAERVPGDRDGAAWARAVFQWLEAQDCTVVGGARNPCDAMRVHGAPTKKEGNVRVGSEWGAVACASVLRWRGARGSSRRLPDSNPFPAVQGPWRPPRERDHSGSSASGPGSSSGPRKHGPYEQLRGF